MLTVDTSKITLGPLPGRRSASPASSRAKRPTGCI